MHLSPMRCRFTMGWLALFAVLSALCITTESAHLPEGMGNKCFHEPGKVTAKVHQGGSTVGARDKRQRTYEPIRILFYYDTTIDTMLNPTQRSRLQDIAIPTIKSFLESSFSVIRATSPILLERECDEQSFYTPVEDPRQCIGQCAETPVCHLVPIPEDHLKRCVECNNGSVSNCTTRPGSVDGPGVSDTDLIIYVSAIDCSPFGPGIFAFASSCQLESELDRPIAGFINFCPGSYDNLDDDTLTRNGLHEVLHVLVFSPTLYPWFRDENGNPRTERDEFDFPPGEAGNTTVQTETYTDWSTRNGLVEHNVSLLITPNAVEQARIHYDCPDIHGVELENGGGEGTASAHWELRTLGNEGMTGFLLFSAPFSRITFGLMEDSGWYLPNYEMAEPLAWGLNTGCAIPHGSCREHITQQQANGMNISPYCDELDDTTLGCTVNHEYMSTCVHSSQAFPPPEFQFFEHEAWGSPFSAPDYCPFELAVLSTRCSDVSNNPIINDGGQLYGTGSRCFQLGRDWTKNDNGVTGAYNMDAGCYMYNCTSSGVEIILEGVSIPCSCEGEEIVVDVNVGSVRYQGSYICPSCASVCYDDLASCPSTEPAPCPGQVTNFTAGVPSPCLSSPCDVNAVCTSDLNSDFTCACNSGYVGDGFTCDTSGSGSGELDCKCNRSVKCSIEGKLTGQSEANVTGTELIVKCIIMFSNEGIDTGSGSNFVIDESFLTTEYLSLGSLLFLCTLGVVESNLTDCAVPNGTIQSIRQLTYIKNDGSFSSCHNVTVDSNDQFDDLGLDDDNQCSLDRENQCSLDCENQCSLDCENQCSLDMLRDWLSSQPSTTECRQATVGKSTDIFFIAECSNMGS
ncbi:leishmanolysin-like peptidase isoform X2 [Halichondria panicea]|uniref:leishmanolysin-like peptidase isoform X2 n=1 Tax=Halichondria panicea TaxID=6063 RepID=UPI00312B5077